MKTDTKNMEHAISAVIDSLEISFNWVFSKPYIEGAHPDIGGGVEVQDVEDCKISVGGDLSRSQLIDVFGKEFVEVIEEYAAENPDTYYGEEY